ncbi:MAG: baculoviral IAP repeat-containing protein [Candidatus Endonucleobacter sp. (ex Gigantidas childressi)]|nr:baculoviral IAP repeat-containing protein [Candidatus Endonucleobacter sp. (ex Gigantidas childressi)]
MLAVLTFNENERITLVKTSAVHYFSINNTGIRVKAMNLNIKIKSISILVLLLIFKLCLSCSVVADNNKDDSSLREFFFLAMSCLYSQELLSEITFLKNKERLRTYRYTLSAPSSTPSFSEDQITGFDPLNCFVSDGLSKSKYIPISGYTLESGSGQLEWDVPAELNEEFVFSVIYDDDSLIAAPFLQKDADTKQVSYKKVSFPPEVGSIIITPLGSVKKVWKWRLLLTGRGVATITIPAGGHCVPALSGWHSHDAYLPSECGQTILCFTGNNRKYGNLEMEVASALSNIMQNTEENKKITMYPQALIRQHSLRDQLNSALPWLEKSYSQKFLSKRHYQRPIIPPAGQHFHVFHNDKFSAYINGLSKTQIEQRAPSDLMKTEFARLSSFSSFPRFYSIYPSDLARVGFYYTNIGEEAECKCFCCEKTYKDWKEGDEPYAIHNFISPNCAYIKGEESGNIPMNDDDKMKPRRSIHAPRYSLANMALPLQQRSITESSSANMIGSITESVIVQNSNNLTKEHEFCQSSCSGQEGISAEQVKYPGFLDISKREKSFLTWPSGFTQTPYSMVNAGFFYTGCEDLVRCFYCGCGLRNWEEGEDPYLEHVRWFPQCGYILKKKEVAAVAGAQSNGEARNNESVQQSLRAPTNTEGGMSYSTITNNSLLQRQCSEVVNRSCSAHTSGSDTAESIQICLDTYNSSELEAKGKPLDTQECAELAIKNKKLREMYICKICNVYEVSHTLVPCGHLCCCSFCVAFVRRCPLCNEDVQRVIKCCFP